MSSKKSRHDHAAIRASLRDYIDKWEAWEEKHGKQASMPPTEWNAIIALTSHSFMKHIDDSKNYLSPLFEQEHAIGDIEIIKDEEFTDPVTYTRLFRVSFKLPGGRGVFPREGHGFRAGEEAPSFPKKKQAKQFAAKHALAFLKNNPKWRGAGASAEIDPGDSSNNNDDGFADQEEGITEDDTDSSDKQHHPAPLSQESVLRKKVKMEDEELQEGAQITLPNPPAEPSITTQTSHSSLKELTIAVKAVQTLAKQMGLGACLYDIKLNEDGTYSGKPTFSHDGRMPKNIGAISGAPSKPQCKLSIAKNVLLWLTKDFQVANDAAEKVLAEVAGDKKTAPGT